MKDSFLKEKNKEKENSFGKMDKNMKANGMIINRYLNIIILLIAWSGNMDKY